MAMTAFRAAPPVNTATVLCTLEAHSIRYNLFQGLHKEERFLAKPRAAPTFSIPLCPVSFLHRKLPERLLGRKRPLLKGWKGTHTVEGMHTPAFYNFSIISKEQRNSRRVSDVFTWKLQCLLMLLRSYFTSVKHQKKCREYLAVS